MCTAKRSRPTRFHSYMGLFIIIIIIIIIYSNDRNNTVHTISQLRVFDRAENYFHQ
jgi:hypothetical protein